MRKKRRKIIVRREIKAASRTEKEAKLHATTSTIWMTLRWTSENGMATSYGKRDPASTQQA